jgi:hypothetical protein
MYRGHILSGKAELRASRFLGTKSQRKRFSLGWRVSFPAAGELMGPFQPFDVGLWDSIIVGSVHQEAAVGYCSPLYTVRSRSGLIQPL